MEKALYIGPGVTLVGHGLAILIPKNQWVGWIVLLLGIFLIVYGLIVHISYSQLNSIINFINRSIKHGKKLKKKINDDPRNNYTLFVNWYKIIAHGFGIALSSEYENNFMRSTQYTKVVLESANQDQHLLKLNTYFIPIIDEVIGELEKKKIEIKPGQFCEGFHPRDLDGFFNGY